MSDDNRPFPIQGELTTSSWGKREPCTIPWWLAEEAYKVYAALYGRQQSLERLTERGGFGRDELLGLLRSEFE
jgi:hypothetical protein